MRNKTTNIHISKCHTKYILQKSLHTVVKKKLFKSSDMMNDSSSRIIFTNHSLTVLTVVLAEDDLDFCVFTRDQSTIVIDKTGVLKF